LLKPACDRVLSREPAPRGTEGRRGCAGCLVQAGASVPPAPACTCSPELSGAPDVEAAAACVGGAEAPPCGVPLGAAAGAGLVSADQPLRSGSGLMLGP